MRADGQAIPIPTSGAVYPRTPLCFGKPERPLFGWLHVTAAGPERARGVIVCNPIGYEYILAHRTSRHLADRLAIAGIPTMRFDYDGTGDSAGDYSDATRVRAWIDSIHAAIGELERATGVGEIVLVGIRFGATLAVLAARERPVHGLVLWAACASGRRYTRELRALAMSSSLPAVDDFSAGDASSAGGAAADGGLEAAGFTLSAECLDEIRAVDLLQLDAPPARRALVVARDDLADDTRLTDSLLGLGLDVEHRRLPGYADMMDEPHFSKLPDEAISAIEEWVGRDAPVGHRQKGIADLRVAARISHRLPARTRGSSGGDVAVHETCVRFGPDQRLFGVHAGPAEAKSEAAAVLLLNTGSVHHVGSNRVYVQLARHLAGLGITSLRFDIAGIGDSPAEHDEWENHPYAPNLESDTLAAIDLLKARHGFGKFIAAGLCSGAYGAFRAALLSDDVVEAIMINPLTFQWKEGMTLETPPHQHYADVSQYRRSVKSWSSWKKVLTGRTDVRRILSVSTRQASRSARGYLRLAGGAGRGEVEGDLDGSLRRIAGRGGHLTFIFAAGDPGLDLLHTEARWTVRRLRRRGAMTLEVLPGADHTFTPAAVREQMVDLVIDRALQHRR